MTTACGLPATKAQLDGVVSVHVYSLSPKPKAMADTQTARVNYDILAGTLVNTDNEQQRGFYDQKDSMSANPLRDSRCSSFAPFLAKRLHES